MNQEAKKVILVANLASEWSRGILRGITRYANVHGPWVVQKLGPANWFDRISDNKDWFTFDKLEVDGIISTIGKIPSKIIEMGLPVIDAGGYEVAPGWPQLVSEDTKIGKMAADHLLSLGFKNFAYCGFKDLKWSQRRGIGFVEAITKAGFKTKIIEQVITEVLGHSHETKSEIIQWLKSLPKPIGIMACNDGYGKFIIDACIVSEIKVPDEVALVGVDNDTFVCELCNPQISSISINTEKAGYETARLLDMLMRGEKVDSTIISAKPTHMVVRKSTNIIAVSDSDISKAIRFIREKTRKNLQVSDVLNSTNLSRRTLERKFKNVIGHTVLEEIKRSRMQYIKKYLIETDMPISQIAYELDFSNSENMSRYFKKYESLSPTEFIRQYRQRKS